MVSSLWAFGLKCYLHTIITSLCLLCCPTYLIFDLIVLIISGEVPHHVVFSIPGYLLSLKFSFFFPPQQSALCSQVPQSVASLVVRQNSHLYKTTRKWLFCKLQEILVIIKLSRRLSKALKI